MGWTIKAEELSPWDIAKGEIREAELAIVRIKEIMDHVANHLPLTEGDAADLGSAMQDLRWRAQNAHRAVHPAIRQALNLPPASPSEEVPS